MVFLSILNIYIYIYTHTNVEEENEAFTFRILTIQREKYQFYPKNSVTAYQTTPYHTSTINPDSFVVRIFGKMYKDFVGRNKI